MREIVKSVLLCCCIVASGCGGVVAPDTDGTVAAESSGLSGSLYVLDEVDNCSAAVAGFFGCVLDHTNWNDLANTYAAGLSLHLGGYVKRSDVPCAISDFTCAANVGGWALKDYDTLLIIHPTNGYGGYNYSATVNGHPVNVAYLFNQYGDCSLQTAYSGHEVFETQTDGDSGDCCDGELPSYPSGCSQIPVCPNCSAACAAYQPTSCVYGGVQGTGSWGLAYLTCPDGNTYRYQRVSPANHEFDGTCSALSITNNQPPQTDVYRMGHKVGARADGLLELFAIGAPGDLESVSQTCANCGWASWSKDFGGNWPDNVAVGYNEGGRLELFAVGNNGDLYHKWKLTSDPKSKWSDGWSSLGEGQAVGEPGVALNSNGVLEVFVRKTNGKMGHIWEDGAAPGGWSPWAEFPGKTIRSRPAVKRNRDGRLEVFAVGADGHLWHIWQTQPHGGWSTWSSFGGQTIIGNPDVGANGDGRLEVFATGDDNRLHHIAERVGGGWSNWIDTGSCQIQGDPVIGRNRDGRLEVFFRGPGNALWHYWQLAVNSSWVASPSTLHGTLTSSPDVGPNGDGRLQVFWRTPTGTVGSVWQTGQTSEPWVTPQDLGGSLAFF